MTDDIVTRLQMFSLDDGTDVLNKLLAEAADEIERLRADRDRWKTLAIENDKVAQIQAGIYPTIPHYEEVVDND